MKVQSHKVMRQIMIMNHMEGMTHNYHNGSIMDKVMKKTAHKG